MLDYARFTFSQQRRIGGSTLAAHLAQAARTLAKLGKKVKPLPEAPAEPPAPQELLYLLHDFFFPLSATRGGSGFGPLPIRYQEILAFTQLRGLTLEPWEVEVLVDLDRIWFDETQKDKH